MRRKGFLILALAAMGLVFSLCVAAYAGETGILMSPSDVAQIAASPDWVVLDCRPKKKYDKEHIQGAITLGDSCRTVLRDGTQRALPAPKIEKILGAAGINNDKHVVVYSDGDLVHASVGYWVMEYMGDKHVHFLDGGIIQWKAEGRPVSSQQTKLAPARFTAHVQKRLIATTPEVLKIARGRLHEQVVDSRTAKEHDGYDVRALRGGYIPHTTVNISHELTFDKATGKLLPLSVLGSQRFFGQLDRNKRTVTYCQTGSRSTLLYIELKLLGFKDVANYDDSWVVYGDHFNPPYPIANEQWMNLEPMQKDMPKMEKEIEKLKKEVEELKKAKEAQ